MNIKVQINKTHIEEGVREDCERFPIALAIRPYLSENAHVLVDGKIRILHLIEFSPYPNFIQELSWQVLEFIDGFDSYGKVEPFVLDLKIPEWALK